MTLQISGNNSVIRSIFDWSLSRPLWQRDALRRIFLNTHLDDNDIEELYELILLDEKELEDKTMPLLEEHLPADQISGNSVLLESISEINGVNNLAKNQELNFTENGLTVVYGDNGSGKSGYTRILKSACRARHRATILPNIFSSEQATNMSALLKYKNGLSSGNEFVWENSDSAHPILSNISVFDQECASVHIKKKNEVAYRPFGLDIPDKLANASKKLGEKLKKEKGNLERSQNRIFQNAPWSKDTQIGVKISSINENSDIDEIKSLSVLTDEDRLTYLTRSLSTDISKTAMELENFAEDIESLNRKIQSISDSLTDDIVNELFKLDDKKKELSDAVQLSASDAFNDDALDGIGGDVWKELWYSAKRYSEIIAYKGREFPASNIDDLCLLCQQPLGETGSENIKKFDEFVKNDLSDRAKTAKNQFDNALRGLPISVKLDSSWNTIKRLRVNYPEAAKLCMKAFASGRVRLYSVRKKLSGLPDITVYPFKNETKDILLPVIDEHRRKAQELRDADDADKKSELESEKKELQDRKIAQDYISVFEDEITRKKRINILDQKIAETNTRTITTLGNSIADDVVTPHLRNSFMGEIIRLIGDQARVEINRSGGSYGSPEYKVSFLSDRHIDVSTVLSEGEQTCVAIASFLAEQATASHKSALVFDDPISSLDHKWRSIVAERLVKEAHDRQVVIFTHDLIFLNDLEDFAKQNNIPFKSRYLDRMPGSAGLVNNSLPWDGMNIAERIDALKKEVGELEKKRDSLAGEEYKGLARSFYSKLRASWERALEEVGLSHTIMRHRDYINSKNIRKISALDISDCEIWSKNFGKCCDYTEAHDTSKAHNQTPPEPNVLMADIQTLSNWVSSLKIKQKNIE